MTQERALSILKTGANVFLTGEPGSGKTHTIRAYITYLRAHGIEPSVTASTGIAATHVHGLTIHSWSGIGIRRELTEYDLDALSSKEPLVKRINAAKVLIIDEVSMLDASVLVMVDQVCRSLRRNEDPFGGLQVIFVGDFFQLPPIAKYGEAPAQFAFTSDIWQWAKPIVCYLSEQHRQEDELFLQTLSAIRKGEIDESIYEHLQTRKVGSEIIEDNITRLYTHNADVDTLNTNALGKLSEAPHIFLMDKSGSKPLLEGLTKNCLSPEKLTLKVGAAVMFTKNNFEEGFVNGTLGTVEKFDEVGNPVINTRNGRTITAERMEWTIEDGGKVLAKLTQIPLRLAWAITVHKSQGMSLDAAVMDLSQAFEYGQGYVALSRVRTLKGVYLKGINQRALEVHPQILAADGAFRTSSKQNDEGFAKLSSAELTKLHHNFITAMGGRLQAKREEKREKFEEEKRNSKKISTLDKTLEYVIQQKSIAEIAKLRGVKTQTIFEHIEKIQNLKKNIDLAYLEESIPPKLLVRIHQVFKELHSKNPTNKLTPVREVLGEDVSFDQIRTARLFLS